jgi:hypothetical protein
MGWSAVSDLALLWHYWFAHASSEKLKPLWKENEFLNEKVFPASFDCVECSKANIKKTNFLSGSINTLDPLSLVSIALCGPFSLVSIGGAKYFHVFVDNKTSYTSVTFYRDKTPSEIKEDVLYAIDIMEKNSVYWVNSVRSEGSGEFNNLVMIEALKAKRIRYQMTVANLPQTIGCAERMIPTIMQRVRSIPSLSGLPKFLWADLVASVVFVENRLPSKQSTFLSSISELFKKKNDVNRFIIIGCLIVAKMRTRDKCHREVKSFTQ